MNITPFLLIHIIALLDSICVGLTLPSMNTYIVGVLKGTHKVTGLLATLHIFSQLLAARLIFKLKHKIPLKLVLFFTLLIEVLCNCFLAYTLHYWAFLFYRCIYYLTNQTQRLCKDIGRNQMDLPLHNDEEFGKTQLMQTCGLIIGPFIGGHLYDFGECFRCVLMFSTLLTIFNIGLIIFLPVQKSESAVTEEPSAKKQNKEEEASPELNETKFGWITILIKYLITIGVQTFFSKFAILLRHNYAIETTSVGYTTSYQNIIMQISKLGINPPVQETASSSSLYTFKSDKRIFILSLAVLITTLYMACNASTFFTYLCIYHLVTISRLINEAHWQRIEKQSFATVTMLNAFTPLVIGVCSDLSSAHLAVKYLSIIPPTLGLLLSFALVQRKVTINIDKTS